MSTPPTPPGRLPLAGHTLTFVRDPLGALERWGETANSLVQVSIAGRRVCLVTDPEAVERILATDRGNYRKANIVRERLGTLQGRSLVLLEGEQWQTRRELLQSGFTRERVASTGSRTVDDATRMVEQWPTDRPVRVDREASDLSLSLLARALFGLDIRGEDTPIHAAAEDILARMDMQSPSTYLPEWVPTPTNRRFRAAVDTLHDRLDETVTQRATDGKHGEDLLSTMVAAGLPPAVVRDELVAFLFAGFDSTATALSCTLSLVGSHPEVQRRVAAELDAELDGEAPTTGVLDRLPTLDAVVRESLRLYPPQYLLFREPERTVTLDGYCLDPETILVVPPWLLHRDRRYWTLPRQFRPERWLDSTEETHRPEYAYLPYGGGPRHCLGARLADQLLRLVVAVVCQRRQLTTDGDLSVAAGPTLSVESGVTVTAARRERS